MFSTSLSFHWSSFCYWSSSWRLYMMAHQIIGFIVSSFLFSEFQALSIISSRRSIQVITRLNLVFSTSLSFIILITGVLQGGYMLVHQGFNYFSKCSSRFFSEELKHSSSSISKCSSSYFIFWGGAMSFFINWVHVSRFTCCQEWDILNPSISSLELSWVIFSP